MVPIGINLFLVSGRPFLCIFNGIVSHLALAVGINIVFHFQTDEAMTTSILMWIVALVVPLSISDHVSQIDKHNSAAKNQ